ncbi:MAG: hypothetical protein IT585_15350 [candidate division Zixibacteria bacterium]|nr:hypothetical protein [candidate division Zixibacteria bacterium]
MTNRMLRKVKLAATVMSAGLMGSVFQAGGCTINIDQELLNQLSGLVGQFGERFTNGPGGGPHAGPHGFNEEYDDFPGSEFD